MDLPSKIVMLHMFCLRAKMLNACLPLRQSTNITDQAQESSYMTSPLRITGGTEKVVCKETDARTGTPLFHSRGKKGATARSQVGRVYRTWI